MGVDVFVLCSLTFHTGKPLAFWAVDKLALVAVCVDGDEFAALGKMAEDGVVGLKHLHGLIHTLNQVFIETGSHSAYVDSNRVATTWGPPVPILEAVNDFFLQAMLAPRVSTSKLHCVIRWVDCIDANPALHYVRSVSFSHNSMG